MSAAEKLAAVGRNFKVGCSLVALGISCGFNRSAIEEVITIEEKEETLRVIVGNDGYAAALEEVARRQADIERVELATVTSSTHPRVRAIEWLISDIAHGQGWGQ